MSYLEEAYVHCQAPLQKLDLVATICGIVYMHALSQQSIPPQTNNALEYRGNYPEDLKMIDSKYLH